MELLKRIKHDLKDSEIEKVMLSKDGIVCAFSGGADSICMLLFFSYLKSEMGINIIAAHVNHMIRGEESDGDEDFCRNMCSKLNIPFECAHINIPKIAEQSKIGLEECARKERYNYLLNLAKESNYCLATAHNATDNLETVLFNLTRGSGIKGMGGISPVRTENDVEIIRPLLSVSGEEIREFLKSENIAFVYDSTNSDLEYTRNYFRHEIVPKLKSINPEVEKAVARLSNTARNTAEYISNQAKDIIHNEKYVNRAKLRPLDDIILSSCIFELFSNYTGYSTNLSEKNINDSIRLIKSDNNGSISLSGEISLFAHKDSVFVSRDIEEVIPNRIDMEMNQFYDFGVFKVGVFEKKPEINEKLKKFYKLFIYNLVKNDTICGRIYVRTRVQGDTIVSLGTNKKLKKLMCDKDIPTRHRNQWPVFCDDNGIIAVPRCAIRDSSFTKDENNSIYLVALYAEE